MHASTNSPSPLQRVASAVPPAVIVPTALFIGVTVLYRFHRFWRWVRIGVLWSSPDNFVQLGMGAGLNMAFGNVAAVRAAAMLVWVPSRVVECMDNYQRLANSYQKWVSALRGDFPRAPPVRWVKTSKPSILSPAQVFAIKKTLWTVRLRIVLVAKRSMMLAKDSFVLSMSAVDAVEALSLNKSSRHRAVNELFLDGANAVGRLAQKKEVAQTKLRENALLADKILSWLGANENAGQHLVALLSTALEGIDLADKGIKKVTDFGNGMLVDLAKHVGFSVCSILGIPHVIPAHLLPGAWEEKHFGAAPFEQYAPEKCLRQITSSKGRKLAAKSAEVAMMRLPLKTQLAIFPAPL